MPQDKDFPLWKTNSAPFSATVAGPAGCTIRTCINALIPLILAICAAPEAPIIAACIGPAIGPKVKALVTAWAVLTPAAALAATLLSPNTDLKLPEMNLPDLS